MKNLVIVESPTKARTIGRFLGEDYEIKASMGHIMDLPKSTLGVDVAHDFTPQFEVMPDKKKIIAELKTAVKGVENIILATDPDREGEAIASHVKDVLSSNSIPRKAGQNSKFQRIVFHEITKEAIDEAFKNPREIDQHLVDAQTARRVLDRLVGYKLSPLLWQKVRRGLSAGRVQSVALRLIVEREIEIEKFAKKPYYTIMALLRQVQNSPIRHPLTPLRTSTQGKVKNEGTEFDLIEINGEKIEEQEVFDLYDGQYKVTKTTIVTEEQAKHIVEDLRGKNFVVSDVLQKEMRRSPQPPYTTSTLQQDASRRLGLAGRRTMSLAQKLYEEGYITYHRTDSVAIAKSAIDTISGFVKKEYGDKYLPQKPRFYTAKQKLAQEAHEAIRPTKVHITASVVSGDLGPQYGKLYDLIWRRAIASQMSDAITESTMVLADTAGPAAPSSHPTSSKKSSAPPADFSGRSMGLPPVASPVQETYRFKANGSVLVFDGFLKINPQALQDNKLPQFVTGESLTPSDIAQAFHETQPPPRYNDASIIKTLEEKGIGRPSTYATIIATIEARRYIEREEGRFVPTPVGVAVNDFLVANFSDIDDIPFTALMEDELDNIAHGKRAWQPMIKEFYGPFEKKLEIVKDAKRVKIEVEKTDQICPDCGNTLVIRMGRFGKFFSCSKFPECKFSKPFVEETGFTCPKDNGKVIVKKTKKGRRFYGCSNYPACDFAAWRLEDIKNSS